MNLVRKVENKVVEVLWLTCTTIGALVLLAGVYLLGVGIFWVRW